MPDTYQMQVGGSRWVENKLIVHVNRAAMAKTRQSNVAASCPAWCEDKLPHEPDAGYSLQL